jgi:hypothetical protein
LAVLAFRRVVLLTSIDPGALRGDLGDRLLLVDLEPISDGARRPEREIEAAFAQRRPRLLGALLDALSAALTRLPKVQLARLPRMADFARVLAACDAAGVTCGALERFGGQQGRIAAEVLDGDPFGAAVVELVRERGTWSGTASELLRAVTPVAPISQMPDGWPRCNHVRGRLKRLAPALAAHGVVVRLDRRGHGGKRLIHLELVHPQAGQEASSDSRPSGGDGDGRGDDGDDAETYRHQYRHHVSPCSTRTCDDGDDGDDEKHQLSKPCSTSDADAVNNLLREAASDDWGVV